MHPLDHARVARRLAPLLLAALLPAGHAAAQVSATEATTQWQPAASLAEPRAGHSAMLLPDGRVLVFGGARSQPFANIENVEAYDPQADTWTTRSTQHLDCVSSTVLADGRALFIGYEGSYLYDPAGDTWTPISYSISCEHSGTLLEDGRVLLAGGFLDFSSNDGFFLYEPDQEGNAGEGRMLSERASHTATRLLDGRVLVAGGWRWEIGDQGQDLQQPLASTEIFDPAQGHFTAAAPMQHARRSHQAVRLDDGRVLVIGGFGISGVTDVAPEIYDPETNTWSPIPAPDTERWGQGHTATLLPDSRVVVIGGKTDAVDVYDPVANAWTPLPSLSVPRTGHTATLLPDQRLLVAGGWSGLLFEDPAHASAELYPFTASPPEDPGSDAPDAGAPDPGDGLPDAGVPGSPEPDAGMPGNNPGTPPDNGAGGGCHLSPANAPGHAGGWVLLLGAALLARRRRSSRSQ